MSIVSHSGGVLTVLPPCPSGVDQKIGIAIGIITQNVKLEKTIVRREEKTADAIRGGDGTNGSSLQRADRRGK